MIKRVSLSQLKSTLVRRRSLSRDRTLSNSDSPHPNITRVENTADTPSSRSKMNLLKLLRRWKKKKKLSEHEVVSTGSEETCATEAVFPISSIAKKLRSKTCSSPETVSPIPSPILCSRKNNELPVKEPPSEAEVPGEDDIPSSHQQAVSVMVISRTNESEENSASAAVPDSNYHHLCPGNLTRELFKLSRCGWYWGPISRQEAEDKLLEQVDGAFLVRDSSDDHYLLSLSFRSYGHILHTRIEHCNGLFSFYSEPEPDGHSSIIQLIEQSMSYSQSGVFCYSRGRTPNSPSYPVRLTKPVSRFNQVRTLQYLCRFVIRQYTRFDHIQKLPLPGPIKGYLEEGHY